ncbi:hypothetical protein ACFLX7_03370 [Chloroflexota bacterium]
MKKKIDIKVDPVTGQKSINMEFDLEGLVDHFDNFAANVHVYQMNSATQYYAWWNERAKSLHKYWNGYEDFMQADSPNRCEVMADAAKHMESWFKQGVLYDPPTLLLGPGYYGEPETLQRSLEIAQGKILANILEYKHIPEYIRPQILMCASAQGYGKGELKASFKWKDYRLGDDIVLDTEGMQPGKRTYHVANVWYDYVCHRLYGFVNEIFAKESDRWKQPQSLGAVDKYLDAEQKLRGVGLDLANRIEYYARWLGYQNTEISEMLRTIGVTKSVEAVKKSYQRHQDLIIKKYGKF